MDPLLGLHEGQQTYMYLSLSAPFPYLKYGNVSIVKRVTEIGDYGSLVYLHVRPRGPVPPIVPDIAF
ncbi:hypothetical protein DPMN_008972 [Dreissena polymorpha]|uniref:Uncharacterized protein n=1 Tax=Dreissena polymorpha TaxID=45954 RepID=A0A9D4RZM6_DREPO|nr:hypothetical protein DPMN_008972 [Dreissena polymorpha]